MDYDLTKGAEYATYIYPFIRDAMLRFAWAKKMVGVLSDQLQNGAVNGMAVP